MSPLQERGPSYERVRAAYLAGKFERRGAQSRLAEELGITRQAVNFYLRAVKAEEKPRAKGAAAA